MKTRSKQTDHSGSTVDNFLEQEGIREEVEAVAIKRRAGLATGNGDAKTAKDKAGNGETTSHKPVITRQASRSSQYIGDTRHDHSGSAGSR